MREVVGGVHAEAGLGFLHNDGLYRKAALRPRGQWRR